MCSNTTNRQNTMGENELDLNNNLDLLSIIKENDFKLFKKNNDVYEIIDSFLENNVSDEAFYIIDIGKVISQYNRWTEKLPLVKPYYAIKCNPNHFVFVLLANHNPINKRCHILRIVFPRYDVHVMVIKSKLFCVKIIRGY